MVAFSVREPRERRDEAVIGDPIAVGVGLVQDRMMAGAEHVQLVVFLQNRAAVGDRPVKPLRRAVVDPVILAAGVVAGPGEMIQSAALQDGDRLAEFVQAVDVRHRLLDDADPIVRELHDRAMAVAEQQVGRAVLLDIDGRVDRLPHGDAEPLHLIHRQQRLRLGAERSRRRRRRRHADGADAAWRLAAEIEEILPVLAGDGRSPRAADGPRDIAGGEIQNDALVLPFPQVGRGEYAEAAARPAGEAVGRRVEIIPVAELRQIGIGELPGQRLMAVAVCRQQAAAFLGGDRQDAAMALFGPAQIELLVRQHAEFAAVQIARQQRQIAFSFGEAVDDEAPFLAAAPLIDLRPFHAVQLLERRRLHGDERILVQRGALFDEDRLGRLVLGIAIVGAAMGDHCRVDDMVVPFDIQLGRGEAAEVLRAGAVYFLLALLFMRQLRGGRPVDEKVSAFFVINGFRRPDAACAVDADGDRARGGPAHQIARLPDDDVAAARLDGGSPAFAVRDAEIGGDQIELVLLRVADEERIAHALFSELGAERRQAGVQVFPMEPVLAIGKVDLLSVGLFPDEMGHQIAEITIAMNGQRELSPLRK